jgi:hypothetical protein
LTSPRGRRGGRAGLGAGQAAQQVGQQHGVEVGQLGGQRTGVGLAEAHPAAVDGRVDAGGDGLAEVAFVAAEVGSCRPSGALGGVDEGAGEVDAEHLAEAAGQLEAGAAHRAADVQGAGGAAAVLRAPSSSQWAQRWGRRWRTGAAGPGHLGLGSPWWSSM